MRGGFSNPSPLNLEKTTAGAIIIKVYETPYTLRRDPNDLLLPYRAELQGIATVMPCGHTILYRDELMAANDKYEWVPLLNGETIVSAIRTQIERDAEHRSTIRRNPYEAPLRAP